jgi:3-hydroxyacyl-CoA dehydrogenase/enoyl-CoA hydratase/3-hydroxybutyryl-CoA epimerase
MVCEGVKPILVENAAKQLGMPVGPLQLTDETSLELGLKISRATKAAMGSAYVETPVDAMLETLVEKYDRLGRKNGKGLYDYVDGKRVGLWPELAKLYPPSDTQPDLETVKNRLILIQVAEAQRAFDEGVLVDKREGDVGAVLGWGFAPWSGGPFSWMNIQGAERVKQLSDAYAKEYGERFRF